MQEKLEKMLFNRNLSTFLKIDLTEHKCIENMGKSIVVGTIFQDKVAGGQHTKFHLNYLADGIYKTKHRWQDHFTIYVSYKQVY